MFTSHEDIECILKFELLELIRLKPEPDYFFKLPEWSEADIVFLLDKEKYIPVLLKSIRTHICAKTLRFTRFEQVHKGDFLTPYAGYFKFFFDPFIIYDWIIDQGLKWPESVIEWHDQKLKLKQAATTQLESWQINQSGIDVSVQSEENPMTETERTKLLKQIGMLALLLSEKSNIYKIGGRPNKSQIAEGVITLLDALTDANRTWLLSSSIRDSISKGLDLLEK